MSRVLAAALLCWLAWVARARVFVTAASRADFTPLALLAALFLPTRNRESQRSLPPRRPTSIVPYVPPLRPTHDVQGRKAAVHN